MIVSLYPRITSLLIKIPPPFVLFRYLPEWQIITFVVATSIVVRLT